MIKDILVGSFAFVATILCGMLIGLSIANNTKIFKGMKYKQFMLNSINVTKDSLECEFYKQYLTPTPLYGDAGVDTINHHNTNK